MNLTSYAAAAALVLGTLAPFSANAVPFGAPSDLFTGCDSGGALSGLCTVSISENGDASASFHSFMTGGAGNNLGAVITHVASESNVAWVDSLGNPLQVTTFTLTWNAPNPGVGTNVVPGTVGLCEFGVMPDGSCVNGDLSDVVIFRANADGTNTINLLSDLEALFQFPTDFNVAEVGGTEFNNGALYHPLAPGGGGEDVFYTINSDPEPATLALLGLGVAGLGFSRRRKA